MAARKVIGRVYIFIRDMLILDTNSQYRTIYLDIGLLEYTLTFVSVSRIDRQKRIPAPISDTFAMIVRSKITVFAVVIFKRYLGFCCDSRSRR